MHHIQLLLLHFIIVCGFSVKLSVAAAARIADGAASLLVWLQSCVFLFVDLLGGYKVSPDMRKRAQELRDELAKEEAKKVRKLQEHQV
jgi:hypothetical protein